MSNHDWRLAIVPTPIYQGCPIRYTLAHYTWDGVWHNHPYTFASFGEAYNFAKNNYKLFFLPGKDNE